MIERRHPMSSLAPEWSLLLSREPHTPTLATLEHEHEHGLGHAHASPLGLRCGGLEAEDAPQILSGWDLTLVQDGQSQHVLDGLQQRRV